MSTSGGGTLNALLYLAELAFVVRLALVLTGLTDLGDIFHGDGGRRRALGLAGLWLLVAVPSLLQLPFPALFRSLRRDPDLIRHHGQVWRVLTSLVVQDGGIFGTVFNLVILALVGAVAVLIWGPWRAALLLVAAHLVFNTMATFLSTDTGAGNSGATFGLAATIAGLALVRVIEEHRDRDWVLIGLALGVVLVGVVLIVMADAHGIPMIGGVLLGALAAVLSPGAGRPVQPDRRTPAS